MHCGRSARDFSVVGPPVGNLPDCAGGRSEFGGSRCCPRPRQTARPALNSTTRLPTTPAIPCAESSARFPGIAGCLRFTMASSRRRSRARGAWRFAGGAASRGSLTAWGTPAGRVVVEWRASRTLHRQQVQSRAERGGPPEGESGADRRGRSAGVAGLRSGRNRPDEAGDGRIRRRAGDPGLGAGRPVAAGVDRGARGVGDGRWLQAKVCGRDE